MLFHSLHSLGPPSADAVPLIPVSGSHLWCCSTHSTLWVPPLLMLFHSTLWVPPLLMLFHSFQSLDPPSADAVPLIPVSGSHLWCCSTHSTLWVPPLLMLFHSALWVPALLMLFHSFHSLGPPSADAVPLIPLSGPHLWCCSTPLPGSHLWCCSTHSTPWVLYFCFCCSSPLSGSHLCCC